MDLGDFFGQRKWEIGTEISQNWNSRVAMLFVYLGVSKNRGTPKWMVYNGKPY